MEEQDAAAALELAQKHAERVEQLEWSLEKVSDIKNATGASGEMIKKLREPTKPDEIEWRLLNARADRNGKVVALIVPYVDARAVMDRLDRAVGPGRWQDKYREISGGFICTLSIYTAYGWIEKEDGSDMSATEPLKGGLSGAFKRAAVRWGIGRDLYHYDKTYAKVEMEYREGYQWGKTKDGKVFYWRAPRPNGQ